MEQSQQQRQQSINNELIDNYKGDGEHQKQEEHQHYTFDKDVTSKLTKPKTGVEEKSGTYQDHILPPITTRQVKEFDHVKNHLNGQFQDSIFSASPASVSKLPTFLAGQNCVWKRTSEFMDAQPCLFDDKIEPSDILQGALGDCYYLSALSALSENPSLIRKLFITQTFQQNGLHGVYLCHDGEFIQIALDDYFPCSQEGGPIFSKCKATELWALFLEKAYAKIYGTYDSIEEGMAGEALRDLTGAPYEYYNRDDNTSKEEQADTCWNFVSKYFQKKYILAASSEKTEGVQESQNNQGIVSEHCYAILEAETVIGSDGKQDRIIKMRNPWGRKEWTGDWGDTSDKWTPQLKKQYDIQDIDDGVFWISIKDFVHEFNQVSSTKLHPEYFYNSIRLIEEPLSQKITRRVVIMRVFEKSHGFVSLHQKDKRAYASQNQIKYDYSLSRLIIGQIDPTTNQISNYKGGIIKFGREIVVESTFEPGDYTIYIEVDWNQDIARDMVVSCYGEQAVSFSENKTSEVATTQILDGLIRVHKDFSQTDEVKDYGKGITSTIGCVAGYVFFLYTNVSESCTFKETVSLTTRQFMEVCLPFKDSDVFKVEVGPKSSSIVKYRVTGEGKGSFNYSTSTAYGIVEQFTDQQLIQKAIDIPKQVNQRKVDDQVYFILYDQIVEVYVNVYPYAGGFAILYQNKTNQTYLESLSLTLTNLRGDNRNAQEPIEISIPPKGSFLISLKRIDMTKPIGYGMSLNNELV